MSGAKVRSGPQRVRDLFLRSIFATLAAAAMLLPNRATADWVLPAGQEAQVVRAINAAFPDLAEPSITIRGGAIEVRLDTGVARLARAVDGRLQLSADPAALDAASLAAAQARLDAAAVTLTWQEVEQAEPRRGGSEPEAAKRGADARGAGPSADDTVHRRLAAAIDLEKRAGHGRDAARQEAIAAALAIEPSKQPAWMQLDVALLERAGGKDAEGRARAKAVATELGATAAIPGTDAGARAALEIRALAIAGDDEAVSSKAAHPPAPRCAVAALLERDAVLRDDAALQRNAARLLQSHADCGELAPPLVAAMRRRGDVEGALPQLERLAAARPDDAFVARQLAYVHARLGHRDAVFPLLDRVVQAGGLNDSDLVDVSHIATVVQAPDAWVSALEARAGADPGNADLAFLLGVVLHYRGRWTDSDAALARAEAQHGKIPRLLIYRAMNHHRLGDDAKAAPFIERAVGLGAEDPDVLYCRAVIFLDRDAAGAKRDLQTYLDRTSGTAEVNHGKQARVRAMLVDLEGCESARSPRACVEQKALLRTALPIAGAVVLLLLIVVLLWRRRRRAALGVVLFALSACAWSPRAALAANPGGTTSAVVEAPSVVRASAGYSLWTDNRRPPPRTLLEQLSWLESADAVQLTVASGLWGGLAVAFFFCSPGGSVMHSSR